MNFPPKNHCIFLVISFLFSSVAFSTTHIKGSMEYCFTPSENCTLKIIDVIHDAQKTLWIQAYQFTSKSISDAVIAAKQRGVDVRIILDKTQCPEHPNPDAPVVTCSQAGIPIWVDKKP